MKSGETPEIQVKQWTFNMFMLISATHKLVCVINLNMSQYLLNYLSSDLVLNSGNVVKLLNVYIQSNTFTTEHAKCIYFIFLLLF